MDVLLDTDVILDYLADRVPYADDTERIFTLIEERKIKGNATSLSFCNIYYIMRKHGSSHRRAVELLRILSGYLQLLKVDEGSVLQALDSDFKDFEDALQYYSVLDYKRIDVILTRNVKDYDHADIAVMTPDSFLRSLK